MKYGTEKFENILEETFIEYFVSYLNTERSLLELITTHHTSSRTKTNTKFLHKRLIERWIMLLDQNDMCLEKRPRTRDWNGDGVNKRINH